MEPEKGGLGGYNKPPPVLDQGDSQECAIFAFVPTLNQALGDYDLSMNITENLGAMKTWELKSQDGKLLRESGIEWDEFIQAIQDVVFNKGQFFYTENPPRRIRCRVKSTMVTQLQMIPKYSVVMAKKGPGQFHFMHVEEVKYDKLLCRNSYGSGKLSEVKASGEGGEYEFYKGFNIEVTDLRELVHDKEERRERKIAAPKAAPLKTLQKQHEEDIQKEKDALVEATEAKKKDDWWDMLYQQLQPPMEDGHKKMCTEFLARNGVTTPDKCVCFRKVENLTNSAGPIVKKYVGQLYELQATIVKVARDLKKRKPLRVLSKSTNEWIPAMVKDISENAVTISIQYQDRALKEAAAAAESHQKEVESEVQAISGSSQAEVDKLKCIFEREKKYLEDL